jgi:hypothetical protein
MSAEALNRKGLQVDLPVYNEIMSRVGKKVKELADKGKPHKVTVSEVLSDALGLTEKKK